MYEHRTDPKLNCRQFLDRQARHALASLAVVGASLLIGAVGYHLSESLGWLDATYAAAMILTGMGPTFEVHTTAGKVFATVYALFSGVVFLSASAILVAPALHRMLHTLHVEEREDA